MRVPGIISIFIVRGYLQGSAGGFFLIFRRPRLLILENGGIKETDLSTLFFKENGGGINCHLTTKLTAGFVTASPPTKENRIVLEPV